jgi:1-acyl-sn-glycerol-3-phosphate acyltransferase
MGREPTREEGAWARSQPASAVRSAIVKGVFGPLVGAFGRPKVSGLENLEGLEPPFILAANHSSHMDTPALLLALPARLRRRMLVIAAADYFYKNRLVGGLVSLALGTVPLERQRPGSDSMGTIERLLGEGWAVLAFPEGSRTRDGRLHRGKTGIARLAVATRVPVVPAGIQGTYQALPHDRKLPRPARVEVRFGKPLRSDRYLERPVDRFVLRSITDEIMYEIMMLSDQEYVDEYASSSPVKAPGAVSRPAGAPVSTSPGERAGATDRGSGPVHS